MSAPHTAIDVRDADVGMAWWNALPEYSRALWLQRAGSACPADAWRLYKSTLNQPIAAKEVSRS